MRNAFLALTAIICLSATMFAVADACDRCGETRCRSATTCYRTVVRVYEVEEECDLPFGSCVEWIRCPRTCEIIGFYEVRRDPCDPCRTVRIAKWSLIDGNVKRTPAYVSGVTWITEDPDYAGKRALKTHSTSCGCGCYTVFVRTCVYRR